MPLSGRDRKWSEKAERTMASVFVASAVSTRIDVLTNKGSDARPDVMLTDSSKSPIHSEVSQKEMVMVYL